MKRSRATSRWIRAQGLKSGFAAPEPVCPFIAMIKQIDHEQVVREDRWGQIYAARTNRTYEELIIIKTCSTSKRAAF
jgi:hypothetical protein